MIHTENKMLKRFYVNPNRKEQELHFYREHDLRWLLKRYFPKQTLRTLFPRGNRTSNPENHLARSGRPSRPEKGDISRILEPYVEKEFGKNEFNSFTIAH